MGVFSFRFVYDMSVTRELTGIIMCFRLWMLGDWDVGEYQFLLKSQFMGVRLRDWDGSIVRYVIIMLLHGYD